ncbi:MAG: hypothetical protein VX906_05910 [Candidatus Thermoplasmatota archaeon]|nr:hypothetical protein [Candidatus Thermoplasmatota archaeon]
MRKALAQNPNMLRTMIGLGMTLIIILSYAVYGATIASSYYYYHTSNETQNHSVLDQGIGEDNTSQSWTFSTNRATTWINVSFVGLEEGDQITIEVSDGVWYYHEMLGDDDAEQFSCRQAAESYEEYNVCSAAESHTVDVTEDGNLTVRGIVSPALPMGGIGSLYADSLTEATKDSEKLISDNNGTKVWTVTLSVTDSIRDDEFEPQVISATHELELVEPFEVDPVTEMLWSISALIGCFAMALVVPMCIYFAAMAKEKRESKLRDSALRKTGELDKYPDSGQS